MSWETTFPEEQPRLRPKGKKSTALPCFYPKKEERKTHWDEQESISTSGLHARAAVRRASAAHTTAVLRAERSKRAYSAPFQRPLTLPLSLWMTCVESNLIKPVSKGEPG